MKNLVKSFDQFVNESHGYHMSPEESLSQCCGSPIDEAGICSECGEYAGQYGEEEGRMHHEEEEGLMHHEEEEEEGLHHEEEEEEGLHHGRDAKGWSTMYEKKARKEVLKDADEKYPNLKASSMKKGLEKMKGKDFKEKAKKNFGWADDPNAAAAAYMRKATKKEPRDI